MASEMGSSPENLFFAGSDDEDGGMDVTWSELQDHQMETRPDAPEKLFLSSSDDEGPASADSVAHPSDFKRKSDPGMEDSCNEIDLEEVPRASSVSSMTSVHEPSSPVLHGDQPPAKKRRVSPPPSLQTAEASSKLAAITKAGQSTTKSVLKMPPTSMLLSAYLGSFVVGNAWSTARGRGYIKPGEEILVEREEQYDRSSSKSKHGFSGKAIPSKQKPVKDKGKTKQLSLATMMKAPPLKVPKRKVDTVVRLSNTRGFEFGRLPTEVSSWISTLLDMGIVEFQGCTMIDCPDVLHSGADLIVSLSIYIRSSAFQTPNFSRTIGVDESHKNIFDEGQETLDEQALRERKGSLLRLFDAVGLKPRSGNDFSKKKSDVELKEEVTKRMIQRSGDGNKSSKRPKIEIVGDGEEVEVEDWEDLSENELDMIYRRAQENDRTMAEMEPADTFTLSLRGYQKQALHWMHSIETGSMSAREATSMHPLWSEYVFPCEAVDGVMDLTTDERPFYFNPYSGQLSLEFPKAARKCKGGILADVGMGKTIMLSALIQTLHERECPDATDEPAVNKSRQLKLNNTFRTVPKSKHPVSRGPMATLIVAPTSLLSQWSEELKRSSKAGTADVLVWHGQNRLDLEAFVDGDNGEDDTIKVVITSYGVLASEHAKSEKSSSGQSPVFEIEWLRVVLDEAHHCKSRISKTAKAVYTLRARRRWSLTGTPIVNKLEDLYSLLKFLDFKPWSDFSFFRSFITLPFLDRDPKAIDIVQVILESVLLRREKNMRDKNGNLIVELPAKEVVVEHLDFSPLEKKIYESLYTDAKRDFERLNAKGLISKNYTHILAMLMRLRRAVLHPSLVLSLPDKSDEPSDNTAIDLDMLIKRFSDGESSEGSKGVFAEGVLENLGKDDGLECPICFDFMQMPMIIPQCLHQSCKDCIVAFLANCEDRGEERRCPTCLRSPIKESDLLEVVRPMKEGATPSAQSSLPRVTLRRNDFRSSTKLDALIQNLRRLRDQDPCFRAVVFSQFTSFLDLIQIVLERERLDFYRFDGSMDIKKRNEAVSEFRLLSRRPKVLIVSLKAGGVGLNLTAANHVFMMDCWWNSAIESQAIDRVHRIGQAKTVYVKHFIVANTIEGRILQIQKRKTAIVKEAFRSSGTANPESLENLKIMFGDD